MVKLNCKRCNFEWDYTGKKKPTAKYPQYTSCPRCRTSVKVNGKYLKNAKHKLSKRKS